MRNLLALIASVGLIGCVGDMPGGGGGTDDDEPGAGNTPGNNPAGADLSAAKKMYDDNVHSIMAAKCSGGACHAEDAQGSTLTRFIAKDPANGWKMATGYVTFVGNFTASAPVLTKIEPGHQGKTYTADEKTKIGAWLAKEVELRNGQPTTPSQPGGETLSQAADRVMSQFAGCMKLTDFQQTNMAGAWANLQSGEGACKRCHASGGEGFIANESAPTGFGVVSAKKMFWLQYFTVDLTQGAAGAKVKPNTVSFAGVCNRLAPHQAHPTFQCANNAGQQALQAFYDKTIANITAGGCAPKQLENN